MDTPIFIVGTPRSGTTLTATILNKHSRIFIPGETHFFDDIYSRRFEIGSLAEPTTADTIIQRLSTIYTRYNEETDQKRINALFNDNSIINDFKANCKTYRDIYSWFLQLQMRYEGKVRWGNQVPRDLYYTSEIHSFFPNAKFIICIRDIKDFLVSYKNKWKIATKTHNKQRLKILYHPIITSLIWKSSMNHIRKLLEIVPKKNRTIVRYETIVQFPEATIRDVCNCIGEQYEDKMLSIRFSNSSFFNGQEGIFQSSVGRWKENLQVEEVAIAQMICDIDILHNQRPLRFNEKRIPSLKKNLASQILSFFTRTNFEKYKSKNRISMKIIRSYKSLFIFLL